MANGEETRGQVARAMTAPGASRSRPGSRPGRLIALKAYHLEIGENDRYIYFFDSPGLEVFEQGIIARARRVVGGQLISTIKFRPVDPAVDPIAVDKYRGFKIEADTSDTDVVKSASLTMPVPRGLIKRVAAGRTRSPTSSQRSNNSSCSASRARNWITPGGRHGSRPGLAVEIQGPGTSLAHLRGTLAAGRRRAALRGLDRGPGRPGRGGEGRLHGLPGRGRRRTRRRPAGQDPLESWNTRPGGWPRVRKPAP